MGRLLAALALIVALAGCASSNGWGSESAAAAPTLSSDQLQDAEFAAELYQDGVPFKDHDDAKLIGTTVCAYLDQGGVSIAGAIVGMLKWRPEFTGEQAGNAVADAVRVYCPEHRP